MFISAFCFRLLSVVAIQPFIDVIDVTHVVETAATPALDDDNISLTSFKTNKSLTTASGGAISKVALPKTLSQYELRIPTEEKDDYLYYFLNKYPGRSLIFVNSIKTARRVDGLLHALQLPSRALHSQLTQKQRLQAMEKFQTMPSMLLIATDVAARGVDISNIQYVIHYDIARSVQLYIHRVGRTARAGKTGMSLSLVNPEDTFHHQVICSSLIGVQASPSAASSSSSPLQETSLTVTAKGLPLLKADLSYMQNIQERIRIAKKVRPNSLMFILFAFLDFLTIP